MIIVAGSCTCKGPFLSERTVITSDVCFLSNFSSKDSAQDSFATAIEKRDDNRLNALDGIRCDCDYDYLD